MIDLIKWIYSAVPNSIKGKVNGTELIKLLLGAALAFLGGNGIGGLAALLDHIQGNLYTVFPDIVNVGWATAMVAFTFDFIRRKYVHGVIKPKEQVTTTTVQYENGVKYTTIKNEINTAEPTEPETK